MDAAARPDPVRELDPIVRWALAALSVGAAFVHFGVMGEHFDHGTAHGVFFAVAAWLQISFALAVLLRPSRFVLWFGAGLSASIIVSWVVSRVWGVPFGPGAWTSEPAQFADILATSFEVLVLAGAVGVLSGFVLRRTLPQAFALPGLGVLAVLVVLLSTLSLVPAVAGESHHATGDAAGHPGGSHADADTASGHGHGDAGGAAAPAGDDHAEGGDAASGGIEVANGNSPCEQASPEPSEGQAAGGHGHRGPTIWYSIEDAATRAQLGAELAISRDAALALPTIADAEAAGYRAVTTYLPCIGAHYMNFRYVDGTFDPTKPEMLLYDGNGPDARIVGLSYYVITDDKTAPEGFAGPNDPWHQHIGLCIKGGIVIGPERWSKERCEAAGGVKGDGSNAWMNHTWTVPGWESPWGVFSGEHPDLGATVAR